MTQKFSRNLLNNLDANNIQPIYALEIDGIPFILSSETLKKRAKYGDEGLVYGQNDLIYGGLVPISPDLQKAIISLDGLTSQIRQELQLDKALTTSISSLGIKLVDLDGIGTELATGKYGEILYRDVKFWVGFNEESDFNNDFLLVFRGLIETASIEQGYVSLQISSGEQKKRQVLALKGDTELSAAINDVTTVIPLDTTALFFNSPVTPEFPDGDQSLKSYVKIEDEIIRYEGISGNNLTNCTRGAFSTTPASHALNEQVETFFTLEGHPMDLALKIMLSNENVEPYLEEVLASKVNQVEGEARANTFYFINQDLVRNHNVRVGDWVKTQDFADAQNNFTDYVRITNLIVLNSGTFIEVDTDLVDDFDPEGSVTFLSQYNTLGEFSIEMKPDEVDIDRHVQVKNDFLTTDGALFYINDEIETIREFIELELYLPYSCYALPSDKQGLSRLSVGIHLPPLPNEEIITVNESNVISPETLRQKRSVNKFHYNVVGYRFEDTAIEEDFTRKIFRTVGTLLIDTGNKSFIIDSKGLKVQLGAINTIENTTTRLLNRFQGAAEVFENLRVNLKTGARINVGDITVFDPTNLNIPNYETFKRDRTPFLVEVIAKRTDIKTGSIILNVLNTNFSINSRYGLISPTSKITKVIGTRKYLVDHWIDNQFSSFGANEGLKYAPYIDASLEIYNFNDESIAFESRLVRVSENIIELEDDAPFTVNSNDYYVRLGNYNNQTDRVKLVYTFISDDDNDFADGGKAYEIFG